MSYRLEVTYNDIMNIYTQNHKVGNKHDIKKAYEFAAEKHAGVLRGSGEPYINHPLRVARLVAEWGFESEVIIACFLHDVVEDCDVSLSYIEEQYGSNVADIVDTVTALSDKDFTDYTPSKEQLDLLSDARLQKKMSLPALYVKIADRIDNLNTLFGVKEEKRIPKAEHTREIIIPLAAKAKAYRFVSELEELCFQVEHPIRNEEILARYNRLCSENRRSLQQSLRVISNAFTAEQNPDDNLKQFLRHVVDFSYSERTAVSIFKHISQNADNINNCDRLISKKNTPLYDMTLVVSDDLSDKNSVLKPNDIFFNCFENVLLKEGFYLLESCPSSELLTSYFLISDKMDNLYRFYVRTATEQLRFMYGNIIDENGVLSISDVDEIEPRDTYNEKIRVFRKDDSFMMIDKGATVLDFAFHIHGELGYHFDYAMIDESKTHLPKHTRLNEGDKITIIANEAITPDISWFKQVKTNKGVAFLVKYFSRKENLEKLISF